MYNRDLTVPYDPKRSVPRSLILREVRVFLKAEGLRPQSKRRKEKKWGPGGSLAGPSDPGAWLSPLTDQVQGMPGHGFCGARWTEGALKHGDL